MSKIELSAHRMTLAALFVLALGTFTSVSFSALGHILLVLPGVYFTWRFVREHERLPKLLSLWALLGLVVTIWASVFFARDIIDVPWKNAFKSKYFAIAILGSFAFAYGAKSYWNTQKIRWALNWFLLATTVATISGLIALWTGFNPLKMAPACHPDRACGLYGMYMTYGYGISLFMVLIVGLVIWRDQIRTLVPLPWLTIVALVNLLGLVSSWTRGGWIGLVVAFPFFFIKRNKRAFLGSLVGLALVLGILFSISEKARTTFLHREGSNVQRLSFFQAAFHAFKERPLLGYGYRNFEPHSKAIKERYLLEHTYFGGHAHNNFLEHLASTGAIGFLCTLLFHLFWLWETYRRNDLVAGITFPFVVSFTVSGLFQYTFGDGENLFLIMTVWALGQIRPLKGSLPQRN